MLNVIIFSKNFSQLISSGSKWGLCFFIFTLCHLKIGLLVSNRMVIALLYLFGLVDQSEPGNYMDVPCDD